LFQTNGVHYIILTKGGKRSEQDFDIIDPKLGTYATTLTFTDDEQRKKYEPGASPIPERIDALKHAHALGIKTWVSLEPVFNTEQTLNLIRQTHKFVDLYKVGKLNYMKEEEAKVDWADFATRAISLLESLNKAYYIKKDLRFFLP
jgi:DNA repair photolyase